MVALTTAEVFLLLRLFTAGAEPLTIDEIRGPLRVLYGKLNEHAEAVKHMRTVTAQHLEMNARRPT